jgi:hypothetical protein
MVQMGKKVPLEDAKKDEVGGRTRDGSGSSDVGCIRNTQEVAQGILIILLILGLPEHTIYVRHINNEQSYIKS